MQSAGRVMRELGGGLMVFAIDGVGVSAAGTTAAAAVEALTYRAAIELKAFGINVAPIHLHNSQNAINELNVLIDSKFPTILKESLNG
jgi:hypothetical protein